MPIEDEKTSFPQVTVQHVNVCFATKLPVEFPSTLPAQEAQLQNGTVVGTVPRAGRQMSGTRDECVFMARLAEQAERFEDMVELLGRGLEDSLVGELVRTEGS